MAQRTCQIDGCDRLVAGRGWCHSHWQRWRKYGDPLASASDLQCIVDGCENGVYSLKTMLCRPHRTAHRLYGDIEPTWAQVADTFMSHVAETSSGCWEWTGARSREGGYGMFYMRTWEQRKKGTFAHRASYELFVAQIPDGLEIDHLCGNPPCVNPWHLEPVTHTVNVDRYNEALAGGRALTL